MLFRSEELYGFDPQVDASGMGPELAHALGGAGTPLDLRGGGSPHQGASEFEPVGKRKRRGTLDGESPLSKKERGGEEVELPQLRGD